MKPEFTSKPIVILIGLFFLVSAFQSLAQEYKPGDLGSPRSGGSTSTRGKVAITVLGPQDTGLTCQKRPTLYFYLFTSRFERIEFELEDEDSEGPLVKTVLRGKFGKGFNRLDFSDHGIELQPGRDYMWLLNLVVDPGTPLANATSSGMIRYAEASVELKKRLAEAEKTAEGKLRVPEIYAENGIWHDAFHELMKRIKSDPKNETLLRQRIGMIESTGRQAVVVRESKR